MQDKKVTANDHVLISIPIDMLVDIGVTENSIIEIYVNDDKIIIRQAIDLTNFICKGNCDDGCPLDEHGCPFEKRGEHHE